MANYGEHTRRWYDKDPVLSKAMRILETSDDRFQICVAINLIKVIIEHNMEDSSFISVDDIIAAADDGESENDNITWYDIDKTLKTAIQTLEKSSPEMQGKIAHDIADLVRHKFRQPCEDD